MPPGSDQADKKIASPRANRLLGRLQRLPSRLGGWLFAAVPQRAFAEALLALALLVLGVVLVEADFPAPIVGRRRLWISTGTLFFFALRLRVPPGRWAHKLRYEATAGTLFIVAQGALLLGYDWLTTTLGGATLAGPRNSTLLFGVGGLLLGILLACFRVGAHLWTAWNGLRRRRLLWELTHAHLTVLFVASLPLVVLMLWRAVSLGQDLGSPPGWFASLALRLYGNVLPLLAVWVLTLAAAVVVVFPPSALVSFLTARRTVRRLQSLTVAAAALRRGDLAARATVTGADEIAQLQRDFNAMAADLQRAMQDVQAERERVEGLLLARRELVATVSHELRTPIATLRGYLESTQRQREPLPPGLQQDLRVMEHEARRLQRLVDDLFTLSRAEVGRLSLRLERIDVVALIHRSVEIVADLAWQRGRVQVAADIPSELPSVLADAERLEQVLQNLLHNAIQHTPPGGIVAVLAHMEPAAVTIEVRDTGTGIRPEDLPHIWERFFRASSEHNDNRGSGLGLAIVKELIEAMEGSVTVTSQVGEGSCFAVRLPSDPPR